MPLRYCSETGEESPARSVPSRPGTPGSKTISSCISPGGMSGILDFGVRGEQWTAEEARRPAPHPSGPPSHARRSPAWPAPRPRLLARWLGRCRRDSALLAGRPAAAAARRGLLPPRHPLSPPTPAPGRGAFRRTAAARRTPCLSRQRAGHGAAIPPPPTHPPARLPADAGPASQQGEPAAPRAALCPPPAAGPRGPASHRGDGPTGEASAEPASAPLSIRMRDHRE